MIAPAANWGTLDAANQVLGRHVVARFRRRRHEQGWSRCCRSRRSSSTGRTCRSASTRSSTTAISSARSARLPADWPVLFLPLQTIGASERAQRISRHADAVGRDADRAPGRRSATASRAPAAASSSSSIRTAATCRRSTRRALTSARALARCWRCTRAGAGSAIPTACSRRARRAYGVHGGDVETSLMLAFRPETVTHGQGARLRQRRRSDGARLHASARHASRSASPGWRATSTPTARSAKPQRRRAAKGEAAADHGVERFIELLRDVLAFDLARLVPGPLG